MRTRNKVILVSVLLFLLLGIFVWQFLSSSGSALTALLPPPENIEETPPFTLPPGFKVSLFAKIPGARVMAHAGEAMGGGLLVSATGEGKIFLAKNTGEALVLAENLKNPHGIAERCDPPGQCTLYIAEEDAVSSFLYDSGLQKLVKKERLVELPSGDGHFTRTIIFLPYPDENTLLISVGSSCDVCREKDNRRAKILAYNIKTKEVREFAQGLRNSVFLALHPVSGLVFATEMGRDWLGDNLPPDEINIIRQEKNSAKNYGWPICYGKNIHDAEFDKNAYIRNPCTEPFEIPSHIDIPAHSAPLGLAFIPEEGWPSEWWYDLLVAYHGSWNRSTPSGYKIVRFPLDENGNPAGEAIDFMTGFIPDTATSRDGALGRPVDILIEPGGTIYVSDDKAGAIYKITREQDSL